MRKLKEILIVDDSKLARLTLSRLLGERDLEVIEAASVDNALEILEGNDNISAIFMDIMMPEKDGFEGLRLIRKNPKLSHIPCSMYSGELSDEAQKKAMICGAQAYLCKPANSEHVDSVLKTLESNLIAHDMRALTGQNEPMEELSSSQHVTGIDNRLKRLEDELDKAVKDRGNIYTSLEKRLHSLSEKVTRSLVSEHAVEQDKMEQRRFQSEIRTQIESVRHQVKIMTIITLLAIIVAVIVAIRPFIG
ncbi:MAG: hypothetical protein CR975_00045 [Gammaproteobacteria bacterium]|nr:MAG: hypothetical protein CR975_00045 [Gammaproteobacteria bacterium]